MGELVIKGMSIGSGRPKVIVSLMGATLEELAEQVGKGLAAGAECFEYRADFAADPHDAAGMVRMTRDLARLLPENPLLFTFRSEGQGGRAALPADEAIALCEAVIADGAADAVDVESWLGDDAVRALCRKAKEAGMVPVVSFHDFQGTPSADEMQAMLLHFAELGAGIPKVAVMAHEPADALALLAATERVRRTGATGPLLTMAMGTAGSVTRLVGETFGSALTFCSLAKASAPGQVDVAQARDIMDQLHDIASR